MQEHSYIPVASDPDTFVRGQLVPVDSARSVRRGWKAGAAYVVMLVAGLVIQGAGGHLSALSLSAGVVEAFVVGALVWGVYRWHRVAALILFIHPIASTLYAASLVGPTAGATQTTGPLRTVFLIVFLFCFAKAALAIHTFEKKCKREAANAH